MTMVFVVKYGNIANPRTIRLLGCRVGWCLVKVSIVLDFGFADIAHQRVALGASHLVAS